MFRFISSIIAALLFFTGCNSNTNPVEPPVNVTELKGVFSPISFDVVEMPREEVIIAHQSGQIETIHKQPFYKKNAPVIRLKNKVAFNAYALKFEGLKENLKKGLDNFPSELTNVRAKWEVFFNALILTKEPPLFPKLKYAEEQTFMDEFNIKKSYTEVLKAYLAMDNYFVTAPNDGFIEDWKVKQFQKVQKNQEIATFYPAALTIYYRIPENASRTHLKNAKQVLILKNPRIQSIRELDKKLEVKINLKTKSELNQIPLSIPAANRGFRFVIPEKAVVNSSFKYSSSADLSHLKTAKVTKVNAHYTVYLSDSIIYLPR